MRRSFSVFILASITLIALSFIFSVPGQAQQIVRNTSFDPNLKVAYVSNQDGDEDIYVIPWNGWKGWSTETTPLNRTQNDQGARDWDPVWSPDGTEIAFNSNRSNSLSQIYIMNEDGSRTHPLFLTSTSNDLAPAWSPDGQQIAFISDRGGIGRDLYIVHPDGSEVERITQSGTIKGDPAWTPDGKNITYWERQNDGTLQLFNLSLADRSKQQRLSFNGRDNGMAFWSPNGQTLFYESDRNEGKFQVFSAAADGNAPHALTEAGVNSGRAAISPDGSLVIYTTDRDASDELYLINADGSALERLTDNDWSDSSPVWQPAVPINQQQEVVIAQPTAVPTQSAAEATEVADAQMSLGQSVNVNDVQTYPIPLQTLLNDYGIEAWQQAGWRGQNMRIGVIDLGFGGIFNLEKAMNREINLPPEVQPEVYNGDKDDHGYRVLEIIHAVAPDAELFACEYDGQYEGFENCKNYLVSQKVNVINHSAGLPLPVINGENEWTDSIEDAYKLDTLWVNSVGNFQQGFYSAPFDDSDGDNHHNFGVGINRLQFNIGENYNGVAMLVWDPANDYGSADLDLELYDENGQMIKTTADPNVPPGASLTSSKRLPISQQGPFSLEVVNNGEIGTAQNTKFSLVIEYLSISDDNPSVPFSAQKGSTIAPADSFYSISVGAVRTETQEHGNGIQRLVDHLAPYSSYGMLDNAAYNKPDMMAYGEFKMPDETTFIGTSAAAPVVAGALALYRQAHPANDTDDVRHKFLLDAVYKPVDYQSGGTYGSGVLRMPPPPAQFGEKHEIVVQPKIIFPQPLVVDETPQPTSCGGVATRLRVGAEGYVTYELGLGFRTGPGENFRDVSFNHNLQLGDKFTVLGGPTCGGSANWWNVQLTDGSVGWVSEGRGYYLITPSNFVSAQFPQQFSYECPNAPDAEFGIGDRAVVSEAPPGGLTMWNYPGRYDVIGTLSMGTKLHVLGGPSCETSLAIRLWYVRVLDGKWENAQGWVSEARPTTRWLTKSDF